MPIKLESGFAILDVKAGRRKLARLIQRGGVDIPVMIRGVVTRVGNDDGVSTEFDIRVASVVIET